MYVKHSSFYIWILVILLGCANIFVWAVLLSNNSGNVLQVIFFDVGQGDAILVVTPRGNTVLVDGGKGKAVLRNLGETFTFFQRDIDFVIASHPDNDHIGGLPYVFERYEVHAFLHSGVEDMGQDNQALLKAVSLEGLKYTVAERATYVLDEGVLLEVLFPDRPANMLEANTGSIVLKITYGETSFLLTGDAPTGIESYLVSMYGDGLQSSVLKLGHHGSKTSSSLSFLGHVNPQYAVVSASCDNPYGHPHVEVLERLRQLEVKTLSTCEQGKIVFESNGTEVRVQ